MKKIISFVYQLQNFMFINCKGFLKEIGMISKLDCETFVRYAMMLQNGEKKEVFGNASRLLCEALVRNTKNPENGTSLANNDTFQTKSKTSNFFYCVK